jgi:hypothetical protein
MEWLKRLFAGWRSAPLDKIPGRNEACWCGSGVKYKRCHMVSDQSRVRARTRAACSTG